MLLLLMTGAFALGAESASLDVDQEKGTSFEIKFSLGWTFGAYRVFFHKAKLCNDKKCRGIQNL